MFERAGHRWCVFIMAIVLLLWPGAEDGARERAPFGPSLTAASPTATQHFSVMNMCHGSAQSNAMTGMACAAHCAVASALIPVQPTFPAMTRVGLLPLLSMALEDHRRPPDPHPPKSILIG